MSNRVLDKLIGNRFQQVVLGFYIGTIVYALFVLSTIRDIDTGISFPAISTYLLIALAIIDIFLFIYFLHYVTQSVKYETIISRVLNSTKSSMKSTCMLNFEIDVVVETTTPGTQIYIEDSGIYQGFDKNELLNFCMKEDVVITTLHAPGTFLLAGSPILKVVSLNRLSDHFQQLVQRFINVDNTQDISTNYYYGFKQLMEIALRALSPGINDPGTAAMSLWAIADLLSFRLQHFPKTQYEDANGVIRIISQEKNAEAIFREAVLPIWDYGHKDRFVQQELYNVLTQLKPLANLPAIDMLLLSVWKEIDA